MASANIIDINYTVTTIKSPLKFNEEILGVLHDLALAKNNLMGPFMSVCLSRFF
jgi:hypothetical protein